MQSIGEGALSGNSPLTLGLKHAFAGEDQAPVPEPSMVALSPSSFVQEEPQDSRYSLDLVLRPFHTPTHLDGGQHTPDGRPDDYSHSEFNVFER